MLLTGERTFDPAPFDAISYDLCARRSDVVILSADLSKYCQVVRVKNELPEQHLDVGMAEQNLLSVAAGVAKGGYIPIATCFACYITRRAYDQMMICMGTGSGPGTNRTHGPTNIAVGFTPGIANPARIHHQAAEDLGMVRAIPNAAVIDPMDSTDFRAALDAAVERPGLTYIRGHRGNTPRLLDPAQFTFELGKTYRLREGSGIGIIATGHASQWALEASDLLQDRGVDHSLLHVPTIKPVNEIEIADFSFAHHRVVTIENHQIVTGLGSLVAEIVSDVGGGPRITRMGLPNRWAPGGTLPYIRAQLGLDAQTLAMRIEGLAR
ncbi:transketolase family protein [Thioalkalivibrio sp. HK1]|uniref:transketolase family protein n=1 Tax=Thioalkalivibrio sp. HK1 TaxID=1469245 RepID=UPI0004BA5BE9|nr:transketolase C-terminal domain-containing protein [Thioalkalivibrio sp. HK1]